MKLTIGKQSLLRALGKAVWVVPQKTTLPTVRSVKIEVGEGTPTEGVAHIFATDLSVGLSVPLDVEDLEYDPKKDGPLPLSVVVSHKYLSLFLQGVPQNDPVSFEMGNEMREAGGKVRVRCGQSEWRAWGAGQQDFPPIPGLDGPLGPEVHADGLVAAVRDVAFAVARDDSRPVLTAVGLWPNADGTEVVTADGFRLAIGHCAWKAPAQILLPPRFVQILTTKLKPDDIWYVPSTGQWLRFALGDGTRIVTETMNGTFPNYQQLIPQTTRKVVFDRDTLLRAARALARITASTNGRMRLVAVDAAANGFDVSGKTDEDDFAGDSSVRYTIPARGDVKIAVNARYVVDALLHLPAGDVALETLAPSAPMRFRSDGGPEYPQHIVMPMFVQW